MVQVRLVTAVLGAVTAVLPVWAQAQADVSSPVVREIVDPATGNRWLLERQVSGAPGKLVQVGAGNAALSGARSISSSTPVIRAGSPVTLVAHTAIMDAELEATALTTAAAGAELRLRLKIGGRIVRGTALGPGRAEWLPQSGTVNGVRP